ncbi:MAG: ABC transporter ATP-binding protein, partial [Paludibacteraceae bacterium]|nr:ABC transporter ATP-binding protein [Paludibacteraceae bacterium]
MATEVVAELLQPYIMSVIVNEGVLGGNASLIVPMGIRMVVVALLGMVGGVLSIYAAGTVSYRMGADMRSALFRKTMNLSFHDMDKLRIGSLITRMTSDVQRVQGVVQASMRLLFRFPILFVGAVSMMLMVHLGLSSVLFVLLPVLIFTIVQILKHAYPQILHIQNVTDRQNTIVQEYIAGIRVVKSSVNESAEAERFKTNNDELVERSLRVAKWMTLLWPVMSLLLNIGIAVIVYYGARLMELGEVNVGDIMACVNYMAQILLSLLMASHIIVSITEARASMSRVDDVLSAS